MLPSTLQSRDAARDQGYLGTYVSSAESEEACPSAPSAVWPLTGSRQPLPVPSHALRGSPSVMSETGGCVNSIVTAAPAGAQGVTTG